MDSEQAQLNNLRAELFRRVGEQHAITIADIGALLGHTTRRHTETFLEIHLLDLGFCVVSSSHGYFRPRNQAEITHYHNALRSRIKCLAIRIRTVTRAAAAENLNLSPIQPQLFP